MEQIQEICWHGRDLQHDGCIRCTCMARSVQRFDLSKLTAYEWWVNAALLGGFTVGMLLR